MIRSADEFVSLRTSELPAEYLRAAHDSAPNEVWLDVIERFPEMRRWGAQNKTVPVEVLTALASDSDPHVRLMEAMKNKLTNELFALLAADQDDAVRARIAYNKNVPVEILKRLAEDQSPIVAAAARTRLGH
jgi:hypothetical protein